MPRGNEPKLFSQAKFDRVQRGFDCHPVDAFVGQRTERLKDECFDLFGATRINALEANRKHRLQKLVVETASGNVLAQS